MGGKIAFSDLQIASPDVSVRAFRDGSSALDSAGTMFSPRQSDNDPIVPTHNRARQCTKDTTGGCPPYDDSRGESSPLL